MTFEELHEACQRAYVEGENVTIQAGSDFFVVLSIDGILQAHNIVRPAPHLDITKNSFSGLNWQHAVPAAISTSYFIGGGKLCIQ